jgi:hypothetical protein
MRAKFEEKTYENYFNNELDARSNIYFPLGQVQEGIMGMDSAAYSRSWWLWRRLGYPFWFFPHFRGADLREVADEMESFLGKEVRNIPPMRVNLLLQYKRPEYVASKRASEWRFWNHAYFRYEIYKEQQDLLAHLETCLGQKALVIYAAPAIYDTNDLIIIKKKRRIIENSNFKRPSELTGHHVNTYIKAGTYSQPCSEPERIQDLDLLALLERQDQGGHDSNASFIKTFVNDVVSVVKQYEAYKSSYDLLMEDYEELGMHPLLFSAITMKVFKEITGVQWLINFTDTAHEEA